MSSFADTNGTGGPNFSNGKGPELSLYDHNRLPHSVISDSSADIIVSPRSLSSELMCPICLDMLKNTMTTKECLHRFCLECITTALRSGNKECPTCRKKLVSRRSLRADPNFDALIGKIYPDRDEYEAIQERVMARLNRHSNPEALQKSIEEGIKHQAQLRRSRKINPADFECTKKRKRIPKDSSNSSDRESSVEPSTVEGANPSLSHLQEIELILRPHPEVESSPLATNAIKQTRYLKTTINATVDHLSKYLAMRVQLDTEELAKTEAEEASKRDKDMPKVKTEEENGTEMREPVVDKEYTMMVATGSGSGKHFILLEPNWTLAEIRSRYWKVKRPLELHFMTKLVSVEPPLSVQEEKTEVVSDKTVSALNDTVNGS